MTAPPPIRVFLVDRHPIMVGAFAKLCVEHPVLTLVGNAHTAEEGALRATAPVAP